MYSVIPSEAGNEWADEYSWRFEWLRTQAQVLKDSRPEDALEAERLLGALTTMCEDLRAGRATSQELIAFNQASVALELKLFMHDHNRTAAERGEEWERGVEAAIARRDGLRDKYLRPEESYKVRENRLRRMAQRRELRLEKSRARDEGAADFGLYRLCNVHTNTVVAGASQRSFELDLYEVEDFLTNYNAKT